MQTVEEIKTISGEVWQFWKKWEKVASERALKDEEWQQIIKEMDDLYWKRQSQFTLDIGNAYMKDLDRRSQEHGGQ